MSLEVFSDLNDSVILNGVIIAMICANSVLLKSGQECGELIVWGGAEENKASEHIQQKKDLSSPNNMMQI